MQYKNKLDYSQHEYIPSTLLEDLKNLEPLKAKKDICHLVKSRGGNGLTYQFDKSNILTIILLNSRDAVITHEKEYNSNPNKSDTLHIYGTELSDNTEIKKSLNIENTIKTIYTTYEFYLKVANELKEDKEDYFLVPANNDFIIEDLKRPRIENEGVDLGTQELNIASIRSIEKIKKVYENSKNEKKIIVLIDEVHNLEIQRGFRHDLNQFANVLKLHRKKCLDAGINLYVYTATFTPSHINNSYIYIKTKKIKLPAIIHNEKYEEFKEDIKKKINQDKNILIGVQDYNLIIKIIEYCNAKQRKYVVKSGSRALVGLTQKCELNYLSNNSKCKIIICTTNSFESWNDQRSNVHVYALSKQQKTAKNKTFKFTYTYLQKQQIKQLLARPRKGYVYAWICEIIPFDREEICKPIKKERYNKSTFIGMKQLKEVLNKVKNSTTAIFSKKYKDASKYFNITIDKLRNKIYMELDYKYYEYRELLLNSYTFKPIEKYKYNREQKIENKKRPLDKLEYIEINKNVIKENCQNYKYDRINFNSDITDINKLVNSYRNKLIKSLTIHITFLDIIKGTDSDLIKNAKKIIRYLESDSINELIEYIYKLKVKEHEQEKEDISEANNNTKNANSLKIHYILNTFEILRDLATNLDKENNIYITKKLIGYRDYNAISSVKNEYIKMLFNSLGFEFKEIDVKTANPRFLFSMFNEPFNENIYNLNNMERNEAKIKVNTLLNSLSFENAKGGTKKQYRTSLRQKAKNVKLSSNFFNKVIDYYIDKPTGTMFNHMTFIEYHLMNRVISQLKEHCKEIPTIKIRKHDSIILLYKKEDEFVINKSIDSLKNSTSLNSINPLCLENKEGVYLPNFLNLNASFCHVDLTA